jgi:dienelactone hydrolase
MPLDPAFAVAPSELTLRFSRSAPTATLAFRRTSQPFAEWRRTGRERLALLLGVTAPESAAVEALRETVHEGVRVRALRMAVEPGLSVPAYLLWPAEHRDGPRPGSAVMAIHGHGEAEPCIGVGDDYHHMFALDLARRGRTVLCPELRGFGALRDLAAGLDGHRLDYWAWGQHMAYSLVTDAFQRGKTLLGETVEDLLRWEDWLARAHGVDDVKVVGISYGGDLALCYPVFSARVERIFASGTLGSFDPIFARCYNAPAHCVPGVLAWLDRADIAGLNAPRPLALHYGELDTPSPQNHSASFNETVPDAVEELRAIYRAAGAADGVRLVVSPGLRHEMDTAAAAAFLDEGT